MRQTCLDEIYNLAKKDKRVVFIGSDLGAGTLDKFKKEMPDRFFMEGVSEANIIGISAGLAMNGIIPYVNTISTFITRRCYEQVLIDIALHNLKVRLIGNGGGLVYAPLGPTHLAFDDVALMRSIPNMTVVAPADATEMKRLMPLTLNYPGPMYIRLGKGNDPVVTPRRKKFRIGKAMLVRKGKNVLLITTGITLKVALEAADILKTHNIHTTVLHMHTIKPIDKKSVLQYAHPVSVIVTIEECEITNGLGSAISEIVAESCFNPPKKFKRVGIPDVFPDKYGSQDKLMSYYKLSSQAIVQEVITSLKIGKEK